MMEPMKSEFVITEPKRKHYKSQNRANAKYRAKTYDRIEILLPKGTRETYRARAEALGMTMSAYVFSLLEADAETMASAVAKEEDAAYITDLEDVDDEDTNDEEDEAPAPTIPITDKIACAYGKRGMAITKKDFNAACSTGDEGTAMTYGFQSTACVTGFRGNADADGNRAIASATGPESKAYAGGDESAACTTGDKSTATTAGNQNTACTTGKEGTAIAYGFHSIAIATGPQGKAKGNIGTAICLVERGERDPFGYPILNVKAAVIDGVILKPDTLYTLKNGEFVEVEGE